MKYLGISSFGAHVHHLEDFLANYQTNFEFRKKFWSRLTMLQIKYFNLPFDILRLIEENEEEVVDPTYIQKVKAYPLLEIDWSVQEEDDLHKRTSPVLS